MTEITKYVLAAVADYLLMPTISRCWLCFVRFARRRYVWLDSTQRIISNRRHWRETGSVRVYMHRAIEVFAGKLDIEFVAWRTATNTNNTRLHRRSIRTPHWDRHSQADIEDCLVNPTYNQFLELTMDEDLARITAENKPLGDSFIRWAEKDRREFDQYRREYNKHVTLIDNRERYKDVLQWGFNSNTPPYIAAAVYEETTLPFPDYCRMLFEDGGSFYVGHIKRFIRKKFPERNKQWKSIS